MPKMPKIIRVIILNGSQHDKKHFFTKKITEPA